MQVRTCFDSFKPKSLSVSSLVDWPIWLPSTLMLVISIYIRNRLNLQNKGI